MRPTNGPTGPTVAERLRLAFPSTLPKESRFVVIFTAYLDESGTHDTAKALSVAGYISTPEGWERFDEEWREALRDFDIPFFHMTDFESRFGRYADWPDEVRRERLRRLVAIINRNVLSSYGASFPLDDYAATFSPEADAMCFMRFGEVLNLTGAFGEIAYVFEAGAQGAVRVLEVFESNLKNPRQKAHLRLSSIAFSRKQDFTPLQAADILAYELAKHLPRQLGTERWDRGARYSLRMLANAPSDWGHANREEIDKFARIIHIRAGLKESELAPLEPAPLPHLGPMVPVSLPELRERLRWWLAANGRGALNTAPV